MNELTRMASCIAHEHEMYDWDTCAAIGIVLESLPARDTWERQTRADEYTLAIADVCASLIEVYDG